jgi:hypothetical protein
MEHIFCKTFLNTFLVGSLRLTMLDLLAGEYALLVRYTALSATWANYSASGRDTIGQVAKGIEMFLGVSG